MTLSKKEAGEVIDSISDSIEDLRDIMARLVRKIELKVDGTEVDILSIVGELPGPERVWFITDLELKVIHYALKKFVEDSCAITPVYAEEPTSNGSKQG